LTAEPGWLAHCELAVGGLLSEALIKDSVSFRRTAAWLSLVSVIFHSTCSQEAGPEWTHAQSDVGIKVCETEKWKLNIIIA